MLSISTSCKIKKTEALIAQENVEMQLLEKGMMKIIFTCKIYINSECQIMG